MKAFIRFLTSRIALGSLTISLLIAVGILAITLRHYTKEEPPIGIDQKRFQEKLKQDPPDWMMKQIHKDLSLFADQGITRKIIDETFCGKRIEKYSLVRFTITDGYLIVSANEKFLDKRHFRHMLNSIKTLNQITQLPNVDFIVSLMDGYDVNPPEFPRSPCFVFAKSTEVQNFVLMPDFKALWGYGNLREQILMGNKKIPWIEKTPKAYWRGSTTGGFFSGNNWCLFGRGKLVDLSLQHPQKLDARFTSVVQCTPDVHGLMQAAGLLSKRVNKIDHLKYKYLVDVDGNSCTYERYFWLLLSNSLVLKQTTPNIQWYYAGLKPYVHYLPLEDDLSDLTEKVQWASSHDVESKRIAENATKFVLENLSTEDVFLYMYHLIKEYSKLYTPST